MRPEVGARVAGAKWPRNGKHGGVPDAIQGP